METFISQRVSGVTVILLAAICQAAPPRTPKSPVIDTHHGQTVRDDYRWLEDWENPRVRDWSESQNAHARAILDRLPHVAEIRAEVRAILAAKSIHYRDLKHAGGRWLCLKTEPPQQQPVLVTFDNLDEPQSARTIVDPNQLDAAGHTSIDWYQVAPDGRLVAVSLSVGGSELGTLHLFETAQGNRVYESIEKVNSGTAGGSLAWTADGQGFYYTRHLPVDSDQPSDTRVYQHVYYHRLGTDPADDRYEMGTGLPQIAEIRLVVDLRSERVLATVQEGDGGRFAHYLRSAHGEWQALSGFGDGIQQVVFGHEDQLYLVSQRGAPRGQILEFPLADLGRRAATAAAVLIPQGNDTIISGGTAFWGETTVLPTSQRIYVVYQQGGPTELRTFDKQGRVLPAPPQLPTGAVAGLVAVEGDDILFGNSSFRQPPAFYYFSATSAQTRRTSLRTESPVATDDWVVRRQFARSSDGTAIPLTMIMPRGIVADGTHPCVMTGYGGYGISREPDFNPINAIWLQRGVIYVVTNLRGGGEFGDDWHRQGMLTQKQNVFDDFAACAQLLIEQNYTRPAKIGIVGGSNGGLLMGAMLTQHPERFKAVVSFVGIYDMLRVELSANGAFNVTEFGSVNDRDQFQSLLAYSPYHQVVNGVHYPATLFLTGANDPRVDPLQSRKMTSLLQEATDRSVPILLRTSAHAGHGGGNSLNEQIEQTVDMAAFLLEQLGVATSPKAIGNDARR